MCLEDTTVLRVPHPGQGFSADFEPGILAALWSRGRVLPAAPQGSGLLVNLITSPAWTPSGKVQTNTPKGALTKLKATWSFLPVSTSIGFPDSFPSRVLALKAKRKLAAVSPPTQKCRHLHVPKQPWLKGEQATTRASLPSLLQPHGSQLPRWLRLPDTSAAPAPQSLTLNAGPSHCSTARQGPFLFLQLRFCQTPNTHTDLFSLEGTWSSLLGLEGTSISRYKVPD